jgi:hypothetical protein
MRKLHGVNHLISVDLTTGYHLFDRPTDSNRPIVLKNSVFLDDCGVLRKSDLHNLSALNDCLLGNNKPTPKKGPKSAFEFFNTIGQKAACHLFFETVTREAVPLWNQADGLRKHVSHCGLPPNGAKRPVTSWPSEYDRIIFSVFAIARSIHVLRSLRQ